MPDFVWKAARADASTQEGRLSAPTQARAMQQLRSQGLTLLSIREAGTSLVAEQATQFKNLHGGQSSRLSRLLSNQNVTQADILVMSSELSIMLKAGLALDNALRVLIGMNAKPAMMQLTQTLLEDVKSGQPLSKALGKHPQQFSDFYINMIRSGEASGQISAVLERLVEHLERLKALRESVISAIIYPCILLGVAVISLIAMLGFVVPQFETLFNDMGDALPAPTRLVMVVGKAFTEYAPVMALVLLVVFWLAQRWFKSSTGRRWWQSHVLQLPILGRLVLKYNLTLFSRSLGTLLGNGVPLISALHIATQTIGNDILRNALQGIPGKVKGGGKMVDALKSSGIFEPLAINLMKVGEETGRMGPMLLELARIFNADVETGIKRGLTLLEPLLIIVLGLMIASIIVSILLGILSVNDLAV
ncbi:type II secretion system F family protein [Limnohabitans sp. 2KL-51]|uniref:type II secretion system F family protein n=1 Tax=Limnohabitans sp. 2KL-51 TaxID=1977911 RepID=UPI000D333C11|nr:type II secretion system F family protein [Limnohabitans sp. 2KL-51]PUE49742.1 type II secretion system protein F [Limnohabitans sp. 2KL-51]